MAAQTEGPHVGTSMPDDTGAPSTDIAIVGMAGRFPGARNIDEFWSNLVRGEESIRRLSDEELLRAGVKRRDLESPEYVRACPVLDDIDKFDAAFFGLSPRDASVMDPAHRFFLEVAWEALEHSGNTGLPREGRVGVFAGSGAPLYWMNNVATHREIVESMGEFLVRHTGNDMNFLATRASYDLDLRGPSINVQTACSSALVAAHLARQSLLAGECDLALIGGSTILVPQGQGYHYKEGEILSPDGHCRPFDHRSAGTVFGSGSACLVLKRLDDALDNGDTIHAVIKGSAVNNDGAMKVGFLAPGVDGQAEVITQALKQAGVSARSVGYVEAHGTGTSVGDPIELTALEQAFAAQTHDRQFCGIGSVKSNIGHLGEAAAAASLIKVALSLKHRTLPPSLGYERPNPRFAMEDSPFFVNASLRHWDSPEPLIAGITALGAGGTNCHVVLAEPPPVLQGEGGRGCQLFVLSAKSKPALDRMSERLAEHLEAHPEVDLADVAYTLAMGRRALAHRRVFVARDHAEAVALLRGQSPTRVASIAADPSDPEVVFTFPGGGAQYAGMCRDLYEGEPAYRAALDECLEIIERELAPGVRALLFAEPAHAEAATKRLQSPSLALPTLFSVEYALARMVESFGVRPAAYIGHSMGEYVAACLAGVFSVRDGLRLVHLRGQLFETTPRGLMIGVSLPEARVRELMPQGLSIAAVNGPDLCVASGPAEPIRIFSEALTAQDSDWTPIRIDVAAHSSLLDPILAEFRAFCQTIPFRVPQRPIASNLTGRWLMSTEASDPDYWVQHLRHTVRFADCVETVLQGGNRVFVEIGPGRTLTTLVGAQKTKVRHAFNTVRHLKEEGNDLDYALHTLGKIWATGAAVDWTALYDEQIRSRVPLPTYPFEGRSYWIAPKAHRAEMDADAEPIKRENIDDWFSTVAWEATPLVPTAGSPPRRWLLIAQDGSFGQALEDEVRRLAGEGSEVVRVEPGSRFRRVDERRFELQPGSADGYRELLECLVREGRAPEHVVLLQASEPGAANTAQRMDAGFFAPAHLAQALGAALDTATFTVVSHGAFSVRGEPLDPFSRLSLGPVQVMPREMPDFKTRLIDLGLGRPGTTDRRDAGAAALARELVRGGSDSVVALRQPGRWKPVVRPTRLPPVGPGTDGLADGDVVLITGGLGGIGCVLAEHLARKRPLRLALLSREGLPPRATWQALLGAGGTSASVRHRIAQVLALEQLGSKVLAVRGDVTVEASLETALADVRRQLGPLAAVIHAAGLMDDEPMQAKSADKMQRVLAPKVLGVVLLDALIQEELKFFVLMSSVASQLGLPGQIDYTAANAFLDAFAEDRQTRKPGRSLAINWNAWRDVGMVVDSEREARVEPLQPGRTTHPWLAASQELPDGRRYVTDFSVDVHWLLAEHRIAGADALIPGTGFIETARAAYADALRLRNGGAATAAPVEMRGVTFLSPFQVAAGQVRRLQVDVQWHGDDARVSLTSQGGKVTHMTAEMSSPGGQELARVNVGEVRSRCTREEPTRDRFLDQDFVHFGSRWRNLDSIRIGTSEALIDLSLPQEFAGDLEELAFHPALLDMATGAAQTLIPGFRKGADFLVPFGYDRIRLFAPVTSRITSHVRLRAGASADIAAFDVSILDLQGDVLAQIDGFTMKRVDARAEITHARGEAGESRHGGRTAAMEALLREAITKEEGVVAFDRALEQTELTQVIASSVDVGVWMRKLERESRPASSARAEGDGMTFSRPSVGTDYAEPVGALESALVAAWAKLLGITEVGVQDDFFELGGNSLVAVRLFARVKRDFGINLPLSTLFQAPTIRTLAQAIRDQGYVEPATDAPTNAAATTVAGGVGIASTLAGPTDAAVRLAGPRVLPPVLVRPGEGKLPLFIVHDGLGEILLYRNLALRLAPGHAVYGLDPEVSHGRYLHTRIVEMARAKVERIRLVQEHGPYMLAGLCAGGVIAFEMARQLQDAGEQTIFVGIIDAADVAAEHRRMRIARGRLDRVLDTLRPAADESMAVHLGRVVPTLVAKTVNLVKYEASSRLERARNARTVAAIRDEQGDPGENAPTIDFLKLYELAHSEHAAQGVFRGGDTVLFRATQGDGSTGDIPFREVYADPGLGWQVRIQDGLKVVDVPGGHSSALQEPHVETLATEVQRAIDAASARIVSTPHAVAPPSVSLSERSARKVVVEA
jgi:acyl transferase domain-containing protein/thioesterase domain-containing protein